MSPDLKECEATALRLPAAERAALAEHLIESLDLLDDVENERLSLGLKQAAPDPWTDMERRLPPGTRVKGKVTNVTDFGVFVEIESGVEGMIHVSQLSRERIENPREQVQPGTEIDAEVLQVDSRERRIALSVKSLLDTQDKAEVRQYMSKGADPSRTTLGDLLHKELEKGRGAVREVGDLEGSEK